MCVSVETKILWLKQRQSIDSKRAKMDGERNNIEPFTSIVTLKTCSIFWQAIVRAKNDGREKKRAREKEEEEEKAMPKLLWFFPPMVPSLPLSLCVCAFSSSFILLRNLFTVNVNELFAYENVIDLETCLLTAHSIFASLFGSHLIFLLYLLPKLVAISRVNDFNYVLICNTHVQFNSQNFLPNVNKRFHLTYQPYLDHVYSSLTTH